MLFLPLPSVLVSVTFGYIRVQEFLLRSAKMVGAHYPERSYKIFILNAPWWFSVVWKVRCVGILSIYACAWWLCDAVVDGEARVLSAVLRVRWGAL